MSLHSPFFRVLFLFSLFVWGFAKGMPLVSAFALITFCIRFSKRHGRTVRLAITLTLGLISAVILVCLLVRQYWHLGFPKVIG